MLNPRDQLSAHFYAYEFAERTGQRDRLPSDPETCTNLSRVAVALEGLRKDWGRHHTEVDGEPTIKVVCGWRSPEHNAAVGGADRSMHMLGLAADVACDVNWRRLREGIGSSRDADRMAEFASFIEKYVDHHGIFGGFGVYTETHTGQLYWLHLDLRTIVNGHVARWLGHHVGSER